MPNTPGFILSPIPYRYGEVRFLALDGGFYILKEEALAVGAPPASAWPETVQHSDYALEVLSQEHKLENGTELSRSVSPALTKVFDGKLETFRKCVYAVFRSGDRAFAANNAANITEQTRHNRAQQLDDMIVARAEKECRAAFVAFGNAYGKVLDERHADRERIYAAAKKRFQR